MDLWTVTVSVVSSGVVSAAIVFGLKKYLGSYLEEKGKNLATHEDIMKLVDQVRETERVKAEITDNVWDRQQRWTAKHALYRELLEALNDVLQAAVTRDGFARFPPSNPDEIKDANKIFVSSWSSLHALKRVARITIGEDSFKILENLTIDPDAPPQQIADTVRDHLDAFSIEARRDLGYSGFTSAEEQSGTSQNPS